MCPRPDRSLFLLCLAFALAAGNLPAGTAVFSNTNYITLNETDNPPTPAAPYPSTISVSNLTGLVITNLSVTFNGLTHTFPSDIDMILTGPQGQWTYLMAEAGGIDQQFPVTDLTITLQNGADPLPILDGLSSGTWSPGINPDYQPFDFPAPAPSTGTNLTTSLSVFQNTDPNGTWSLYIVDESAGDSGYISGGWSLSISTGVPLQIAQSGTNAIFSWPYVPGQTFSLQYSPTLATPIPWTNVTAQPSFDSGWYSVTNPAIGYYRLIGQ